ncbi:beta-ketoacyl synthase-like protein [Herbihabitans rhizosphaerae]|uniref:Beta-ketoacyl synthase-like protein n=1 Tax=Herbihabitans rhizosphaerae TaxID=1872711 RepID=A0A4Q7KDC5_9PSEU|nr:beta-ketoacyl synthase N-terminal-like domain-containing protein [Herbihabitans rhizosphaerae]RZS31177.1 beta-ketoacyl synthase-like protein [Herbihabitans rhizosphaerae]
MRKPLHELEIAAAATALPPDGERATVDLRRSGPPDRGDTVDLPAFATDPRTDPAVPAPLRRRIDRFAAVAHLAVNRVLADLPDRPPRERIGVFLVNARAGWSYGEPELALLVDQGAEAMHAYQATAWFPAAAQGEVTIDLDLRGCAKTTAGRASGFAEALWLARDALERDAVDLALVGAAESLVNGFVLRDWPAEQALPDSGPAEGAVVFALRRPTDEPADHPATRLHDLRHEPETATPQQVWAPTLSAAADLYAALAAAAPADVDLGGGFRITVHPRRSNSEHGTE